ncbi:MAG: transketolase [Pseudomonadota bacterium]|nr:transketolase [Pseudomonadota bacterium]
MTAASPRDLANALRVLAIDAVQKANSGHPGMPMGMADMAEALWNRHLRHNPGNPHWADRDRFVLSNGHGSMLIYGLLHLSGYALGIDDLKAFRQLHSKTPGHPEHALTPGIETTTGPLGQGLANAVGMAIAERMLAAEFNRPGHTIVDHHTYVFLGDGCLMEGISHEVCSLAGTLGLSRLIALYDDNGISIDGEVQGWFGDDTPARFRAYGWNVIAPVDGHDADAVSAAIAQARNGDRPTLICCKTRIGKGSPAKEGSAEAHGAPLGEAEIAATRKALGWSHAPFEIPAEVYAGWDARARGAAAEEDWNRRFAAYRQAFPADAAEFLRRQAGDLPGGWSAAVQALDAQVRTQAATIATRKASQNAIAALAAVLPELVGGSADLTGSNLTNWPGMRTFDADSGGRYLNYGVREFGMSAIMNGLALHGGLIPFGGTFLTFADYARNAVRMAALMKLGSIFVYTHDSIGLGEDGPTHQPVEHLASLRVMPGLDVWRPADTLESAYAWICAVERNDGPSALVFSRQNLPYLADSARSGDDLRRGGYVLREAANGKPQAVLIATGSEVALALQAQEALALDGIAVRVVSMPSTSVFDRQAADWQARVLPRGLPRVAVEAGSSDLWRKYVGLEGRVIGLDRFGESAPAGALFKLFGFSVERVAAAVRDALS